MIGKIEERNDGDVIDYTYASAVVKDTPIYVAGLGALVPQASADANVSVAYKRKGLYRAKPANSIAVTIGTLLFYDTAADRVVITRPTAGFRLGVAVTAGTGTTAGTVTVDVLINTVNDGTGNFIDAEIYSGKSIDQTAIAALSDGAVTLTAAQVKGGIATMTPTAGRAVTLPAASDLLAIMPRAVVGSGFEFTVKNLAAATHAITVTASASMTNGGVAGDFSVAASATATYRIVFSNVTAGAVAAVLYKI